MVYASFHKFWEIVHSNIILFSYESLVREKRRDMYYVCFTSMLMYPYKFGHCRDGSAFSIQTAVANKRFTRKSIDLLG